MMTIGTLAEKTGVGIETIRYYERRNLVLPVARKASGYRVFDESSVHKIRFIKNGQKLGFTLNEIGTLLALRVRKSGRCGDVKLKAEEKIVEIESKIESLRQMKNALAELIDHCHAERPTGDCPILKSINGIKED
jgi:DNA-binding transcriptional MerR regulator